ncbi:recombinase family protein [Elusimicrobiota bacterium]
MQVNCAVYTRVSTDNQAEKNFNSCESQELKIKSFIDSQENLNTYRTYSDPGFTGANLERPGLQEMLFDIQNYKVNLVIAYKIDRLTRSPKDFYNLVETFEQYGVDFISVTERFDTSTPSGRLLRNIMLTFAQFERELTSERTKDKLLQRAQKGLWNGGNLPFGYKAVDKQLVPDKEQSKIIKDIFITYLETGSISAIHKKINSFTNLSKDQITYVLKNPVYTGKIKYNDNIYDGVHQAIITESVFNKVQPMFSKKRKIYRTYKNHLLGGLIQCSECGSLMTSSHVNKHSKGKMKHYYYYRCTKTYKNSWDSCSTKQINADKLEGFILNRFSDIVVDDFYINSLVRVHRGEILDSGYQKRLELLGESPDFPEKLLKKTLENIVKILSSPGGKERNLNLRKFISAIEYSKEKIKIRLNNAAYLDSSADLPTTAKPRRTSLDESRFLSDYPHGNVENAKAQRIGIKYKPVKDFSSTGSHVEVGSPGKTRTYNLVVTVILSLLIGLDYLITIAQI